MDFIETPRPPTMKPASLGSIAIADAGKVYIGGFTPALPPVGVATKPVADFGTVRFGGFAPSLPR